LPQLFIYITIGLIVSTAIGSTIALYFVTKYDGFIAFTVSYLIITFTLGIYAGYRFYNDIDNNVESPNFFTPHGDVYKFDKDIGYSTPNIINTILFLIFLLLIYFYSLLLQIFVYPVQLGVSFTCLF